MPDNSSGYVDFNQYSDLNSEDETRLLEEAMGRAETASANATGKLAGVKREASGHYNPDGTISGEASDITKAASYGDYLSAHKDAAKAWAALSGQGKGNANSDSLRNSILARQGRQGTAQAATSALKTDEQNARAQITGQSESLGRQRTQWAALAAEKEKARSEREKSDKDMEAASLTGAYQTWMAGRENGGGLSPEAQRAAQRLSMGVDSGFRLPDRTSAQQAATSKYGDRRGFAIEQDAWGTNATSFGRPATKKGTSY